MKQYSFLQEEYSGEYGQKIANMGAGIGLFSGALVGALKNQQSMVDDLEKKFQQTGNEKFKIAADKIRNMSPLAFKTRKILKHGFNGAASGLLSGAVAGVLYDRYGTKYDDDPVINRIIRNNKNAARKISNIKLG